MTALRAADAPSVPPRAGVRDVRRAEWLIANCPDAYLEIDRRGTVVEWNTSAESLFGWAREEVVGRFASDTVLPGGFARSAFGVLLAGMDGTATGASVGPEGPSGGLSLVIRHRGGHRLRTGGRLFAAGEGLDRTVAAFLWDLADRSRAGHGSELGRDAVTGLSDRSRFGSRLAEAVAAGAGLPGSVAVVLLDLDRFRAVNNSLGHAVGDAVLSAVARRLEMAGAQVDCLARSGGDEFLALVHDATGRADRKAAAFVDRIRLALSRPFALEGSEVFLSGSVGIALNTFGVDDPEDLLAHAEAAMYQAKRRAGFAVETFEDSLRIEGLDRVNTERSLHRALERRELLLHYQPVVELGGGTTVGFEALVRWHHPERGLIGPQRFIPVAEESGLIIPIGAWVLEQACHQLRRWHQLEPTGPAGSVEVNLSARQVDDPEIVRTVEQVLTRTGLSPEHLTLEITESALMKDAAAALVVLRALKEIGVLLAIDDFGTGYSSLSYLQRFPLDIVKIDRTFVEVLGSGPEGEEIVAAVISLAHALGLDVVAEGVETVEQLIVLRALRCDLAQGYLFSRPLAEHELRDGFDLRRSA